MAKMLHLTLPARIDTIMEEGLRCDMETALTVDIDWTRTWYQAASTSFDGSDDAAEVGRPLFLGMPDCEFLTVIREEMPDLVTLEIDTERLPLVADLASLVDRGAIVENGCLWWKVGREPVALLPYLDDGEIEIEHLLDPRSDACRAAIESTGTAACLSTIGPERITIQEPALAPSP